MLFILSTLNSDFCQLKTQYIDILNLLLTTYSIVLSFLLHFDLTILLYLYPEKWALHMVKM
jgi:hypothetical protein